MFVVAPNLLFPFLSRPFFPLSLLLSPFLFVAATPAHKALDAAAPVRKAFVFVALASNRLRRCRCLLETSPSFSPIAER
ncbi:hypothetical protein SESBI_11211 [Sesbania bispinosa]|nr:hypothetical protein SESBI_11211 [Sesbania bispinosa]